MAKLTQEDQKLLEQSLEAAINEVGFCEDNAQRLVWVATVLYLETKARDIFGYAQH